MDVILSSGQFHSSNSLAFSTSCFKTVFGNCSGQDSALFTSAVVISPRQGRRVLTDWFLEWPSCVLPGALCTSHCFFVLKSSYKVSQEEKRNILLFSEKGLTKTISGILKRYCLHWIGKAHNQPNTKKQTDVGAKKTSLLFTTAQRPSDRMVCRKKKELPKQRQRRCR